MFTESNLGMMEQEQPRQTEPISFKDFCNMQTGQFRISGDMQYADDKLLIHVKMVNKDTDEEIWSQQIEYKLTRTDIFDIQDDVAKRLISAVGDYCRFVKQNTTQGSGMAVA